MFQKKNFSDADISVLQDLLERCEGVPISCQREISGVWFLDDTRKSELRLLILANFRLTVSRVAFLHRRQGTMTKVVKVLEDFCQREGLKELVVQSVETQEMSNWCFKNGFVPVPSASLDIGGVIVGDYRKVLKKGE